VAARFGGEEIAVLLPETSKEGAAAEAERVRAAVAKSAFPGDRRISISVGIAGFPDDASTPADLIRCAETALTAAKSSGRNCVRAATGGEAEGGLGLEPDAAAALPERFTTYHVRLFDIVSWLCRDRSLACLFVDLSELRVVERELGPTQHADLFARAGDMLDAMRGDLLRPDDMVCRTDDQDGYLCFLASPRGGEGGASADLEPVASRVEAGLERELSAITTSLTRELPRVVVGFARVLDNPLVRPERLLVRLVADAQRSAVLHRERAAQRHKALLQEIILRGMLRAVYQPIVDLASGGIFGYEGLSRGPRDSTLESPAALFTVADQVDLTFELDRACFRGAMSGAIGLEPVHRLFLNLLPTSFYDSSFIETEVPALLEAAALTPANLVFEINERLAIENFTSFRAALATYTRAGFGVAIDDVGTRHSNLEAVMALRPHFLKLSDVLTRGVSKSTVKREMVRSLQRIADAIDAVIVAEGIERQEDLAVLCDLGVRYGQGYFLARPGEPFPQLRTSVRRAVRAARASAPHGPLPLPPRGSGKMRALQRLDGRDLSELADATDLDDDSEVTDEIERLRLLGGACPALPLAEPDPAPSRSDGASHRNGNGARRSGQGRGGNGNGAPPRDAEDAEEPGSWRPLGEELGAGGETPLIRALRLGRPDGSTDVFFDEEEKTQSGL
jgi:EAL domain-containing protein (putative c-di-GMP-specific phosphodiesterase class I)